MQWLCWKISGPYLDIIRPAVLLPLVFDSALDQLQCFLPCRPWAFELPCCVMSTVIQCGSKALGQGVAAGPSLRAELCLCTVFGIWGRMNTWGWGERKEIRAGIERERERRWKQRKSVKACRNLSVTITINPSEIRRKKTVWQHTNTPPHNIQSQRQRANFFQTIFCNTARQ